MPTYTIDIIGVTGTSYGSFTSLGVVGTMTFTDDDSLGVGDNAPDTETANLPVITGVTGTLPTSWIGSEFGFGWQQQIDGTGGPDAIGMFIFGFGWSVNHLIQYPGGTPIVTGSSYSASGIQNVPNEIIVCFAGDTLIETDQGAVAVQDLKIGDLVLTQDRAYQPLRWIGSTGISSLSLCQNPKLRPIRIMAGALGRGLPLRDLVVSRQHRVLVSSKIAERMFGTTEVLLPAIKLTELPGIFVDEAVNEVEYFHLLFDQHEVIFSEGAPTESLYTGPEALKSVPEAARAEILELFPELAEDAYQAPSARHIPKKGRMIKQLVQRHLAHERPLLSV